MQVVDLGQVGVVGGHKVGGFGGLGAGDFPGGHQGHRLLVDLVAVLGLNAVQPGLVDGVLGGGAHIVFLDVVELIVADVCHGIPDAEAGEH